MEKQQQNYRHQQKITSRHCRHIRCKMKVHECVCPKKPSVKRSDEIIENKQCCHACRYINKEIKVVVQCAIFSIDDEYLLDKQ